jgi:hypothetical protein
MLKLRNVLTIKEFSEKLRSKKLPTFSEKYFPSGKKFFLPLGKTLYGAFQKRFDKHVFTQLRHQFQKLYIRRKIEELCRSNCLARDIWYPSQQLIGTPPHSDFPSSVYFSFIDTY